MSRTIEKLIALFCLIVFITFLVNHGKIDFSGVDFVVTKAKDAINSEEGQAVTNELKEISSDVLGQLTDGVRDLITNAKGSKERIEATFVRVVDGDTIIVRLEDEDIKVRMIGIDTPESVHADESKNNIYGTYASDYTKGIFEDIETVYLEFDEETEDTYDRILAYVWLDPEVKNTTDNIGIYMVNGILLKDGYAIDKVYEPNNRYATSFTLLRKEAVKNEKGLWKEEEFKNLWTD